MLETQRVFLAPGVSLALPGVMAIWGLNLRMEDLSLCVILPYK